MVLRSIAERHSSSTLVGVATLLGTVAVLFGPLRPDLLTFCALAALALGSAVGWWFVTREGFRMMLITLGFASFSAFVTALVSLDELAQRWSPADEGQRVIAMVHIDSLIARHGAGVEFDAELLIESPASLERAIRARVVWREPPSPRPRAGERWRLLLQMRTPRTNTNPGGFDEQREFFRDRIHARATVLPFVGTQRLASAPWGLLRLRDEIVRHIRKTVVDRDAAALFAGLAVGATGEVSREQWQVFSNTGTTHLVAISGMHVTLFCWVVAALARRLWRSLPRLASRVDREQFAGLLGVPAAALYAALAGFGIPAQRTVIMLAVWWGLRLAGRVHSGFDVLAIAAIAVLAIDPLAPLSSGFWLSFVAMATLIAFEQSPGQGVRAWVLETLRTQWHVSIALLPVTVWWFSSLSIAGLLVNLAAIPVFSWVLVPVALIGSVLSFIAAPIAKPIWWLGERVHEWCWPALVAIAAHPLATIQINVDAWRPSVIAERAQDDEIIVTMLEAGDGTALILRTRRHTLVYDTGETYASEGRSAERLVIPALRALGVSRIDVLVLSASHAHRAEGAARLMTSMPVDRIIAGGAWPGAHRTIESCSRGHQAIWDGVEIRFFGVPGGSCALRVGFAEGPSLLMADRLEASESSSLLAQAEANGWPLRSTVMLAPRRGADAAVSAGFVAAVDAQWLLLPGSQLDGRRLDRIALRWRLDPSRVQATAQQGAITLHLRRGLPPRWLANADLQGHPLWRYHPGPYSSGGTDAMQDRSRP